MPPQGLGEQRVQPFVAGNNTKPMDQNSPGVTFLPPDEKMMLANTMGSLVPRVRKETLHQAHQLDPSLLHNTSVTPPTAASPNSLIVDLKTKLPAQMWPSEEEVRGASLPGRKRSTATRLSVPNHSALSQLQAADEAPSPREQNKKLKNNKALKKEVPSSESEAEATSPLEQIEQSSASRLGRWNSNNALYRREKVLLPPDFQPLPKTVILGNRKAWHLHSGGNLHLKDVCRSFIPTYLACNNKDEKSQVVTDILSIIYDACPVGAFVREKDGRFHEVQDICAREKIATTMRYLLPNSYYAALKIRIELRKRRLHDKIIRTRVFQSGGRES
jgi:hypothetical protein